jgi:hypothetical protein
MTTAARRSAAVLLLSFGPLLASTLSPPDWSDPDWYTTADGLQWASRFTSEAFAAEGFAPMAECGGRGALGRIIGGPSRMAVYVRGVEASAGAPRKGSCSAADHACAADDDFVLAGCFRHDSQTLLRPEDWFEPRGFLSEARFTWSECRDRAVREGAPWFVMENPQEHIPATEAVVTADRLGRPVRVHRGGARADGPLRVGDAVGMWMQASSLEAVDGPAALRGTVSGVVEDKDGEGGPWFDVSLDSGESLPRVPRSALFRAREHRSACGLAGLALRTGPAAERRRRRAAAAAAGRPTTRRRPPPAVRLAAAHVPRRRALRPPLLLLGEPEVRPPRAADAGPGRARRAASAGRRLGRHRGVAALEGRAVLWRDWAPGQAGPPRPHAAGNMGIGKHTK